MIVLNVQKSFNNPFLPKLKGVSPDIPFVEVRMDFGATVYSDASWQKITTESGADNTAPKPVQSKSLINAQLDQTSLTISSSDGWRWGSSGPDTAPEYPDKLGSDYLFIGDISGVAIDEAEIYIDGLSKKRLYSLEIFAARETDSDVRVGYYSANGVSGSLNAADNISNTLLLENIAADEDGRIIFNVKRLDSDYAYINALVLKDS